MSGLRVIALLFVLFALVSSVFVLGIKASDVEDVTSAIEGAESAMGLAYEAVLEAEGAGADVTGLLDELNVGAEALSKAHMSYRVGDYDDAVYLANSCCDSVKGIEAEAINLRDAAAVERRQRLLSTSLSSIVAVGCIFCGGFFGWRLFKRRYYRRILKMKPEVENDES